MIWGSFIAGVVLTVEMIIVGLNIVWFLGKDDEDED